MPRTAAHLGVNDSRQTLSSHDAAPSFYLWNALTRQLARPDMAKALPFASSSHRRRCRLPRSATASASTSQQLREFFKREAKCASMEFRKHHQPKCFAVVQFLPSGDAFIP
jgi:hypothetical protein